MALIDTASGTARSAHGKSRAETNGSQFWVQALPLLRALNASTYRNKLALMFGGIALVILTNTFGQIKLNAWLGSFYDTLVQRSLSTLAHELLIFLVIVGGLLCLVVAQTWLQETLKVKLREWLTHDLMDQWLKPRRAYLLTQAGEDGSNPDQYIQADARHLAEMSASLAIGLFHATLLLVSFIGVLWALSSQVVFTWGDKSFTIPGYMVWCALAYAITGSWLTWLVGHPLIKLNAERYAKEADLRFAIVRINETAETVALGRGEADERRTADSSITSVIDLGCKLANGLSKLTWITSGYGWLAIIVPILVAVPGFFSGKLTIGGLMMVVGAFNQVQNSLKWFVDNFPGIADWRATLLRVSRFRAGLSCLDPDPEAGPSGITVGPHPAGQMSFENLSLDEQGSTISFATSRIDVRQGERVLIENATDCDKTLFLRAMAGLWTEGTGSILLPPAESIMFIPARAHFRIGTLREAMTYPADQGGFDDAMISAALVRVGLMHLIQRLDDKGRWDRALPTQEQQRLVLARLVLHRPDWVLFEDIATTGNEHDLGLLRSVFTRELSASAVIGVGNSPALGNFFARRLRMARHMDAAPRATGPDATIVRSGRPLEAAE